MLHNVIFYTYARVCLLIVILNKRKKLNHSHNSSKMFLHKFDDMEHDKNIWIYTYKTCTSCFTHANDYDLYSSCTAFTLKVNCLRRTIIAKDNKKYYVCVEKLMLYQSLAFRYQTFNQPIYLIKFYQKFWILSVREK